MRMDDQVFTALRRIPLFEGASKEEFQVERLGGLTNLVYRVDRNGETFALRIAGEGTEDYIDRKVEGHNARVAAGAGVSPEVLFFDEADGLMLTAFLHGCATMTPETFPKTPGAPARAAEALKRMHACGKPFEFRFELFAMIEEYLSVLDKLGAGGMGGVYQDPGFRIDQGYWCCSLPYCFQKCSRRLA